MLLHTIILSNIVKYTRTAIFGKLKKTQIVHHLLLLLLFLLLLSSSVQTAYRETGDSNRSISFTKIIYAGACMILDIPNLHTYS